MPQSRFSFQNPSKESIVGVLHQPSEPTSKAVIVCHGFGGSKDRQWIADMCNALAYDGITGVRFDFSGNGESQGSFEDMSYLKEVKDLQSCMDALEAQGYTILGVVGHSMGATVSLLTAAYDKRIKAVVNIAGVANPANETHIAFATQFYETAFAKPVPSTAFVAQLHELDVMAAVSSITAPLLTIHGDADQLVPLEEGKAIHNAANEPKKMVIAMGSGHRLSQDADFAAECITLSVQWMKRYLNKSVSVV